jgi:hypothetical protein
MTTTIMRHVGMAPSAVPTDHLKTRLGLDFLRPARALSLALVSVTLPLLLLPVLLLAGSFLFVCIPMIVPFMLLGVRGLPLFPPHPDAVRRQPTKPPRVLRGRLWDARDFA